MIKRSVDVEIKPDPTELAECFCEMSAFNQAVFFNRIKMISDTWEKDFSFQLEGMINGTALDDGGRSIMVLIGEYAGAEKDEPEPDESVFMCPNCYCANDPARATCSECGGKLFHE